MGISPFQLLVVLIIFAMVFGTGKLKNIGTDLGAAIKGFKDEMNKDKPNQISQNDANHNRVIEGEVVKDKNHSA